LLRRLTAGEEALEVTLSGRLFQTRLITDGTAECLEAVELGCSPALRADRRCGDIHDELIHSEPFR